MKKSKFTETQIGKAIQDHESGHKAEEMCGELGITTASFCKWRQCYGGMEVSDVKRMHANLSLVHKALKDAVAKKL